MTTATGRNRDNDHSVRAWRKMLMLEYGTGKPFFPKDSVELLEMDYSELEVRCAAWHNQHGEEG